MKAKQKKNTVALVITIIELVAILGIYLSIGTAMGLSLAREQGWIKEKAPVQSSADKGGNKRRSAEVNADNIYFGESKGRSEGRPAAQNSSPGYDNVPAYTPPATYQQPVQPPADEFPELLGYDANNPFGGDDFDQLDF